MAVSPAPAAGRDTERLWFSQIAGAALVDSRDERLGKVDDVIARIGDGVYPPVTGVVSRIGGRRVFIPEERVSRPDGNGVMRLVGETLNLLSFERRQGEVLLGADVLGRRVISVDAGRLVHANDIAFAKTRGRWRVTGIDTGPRGLMRRLLPWSGQGEVHREAAFVDWSNVEPFVGHVPGSRLLPLRRLRRLHPAQIADLVEAASHDEGEEIISAVHSDPELEADVFEELDIEHQVEFLRDRSDEDAAKVLAEMNADDAADLITDLDQNRRAPILAKLPAPQQAKVRALLSYNSESAGGLMSTDFVALPASKTAGDALAAIRAVDLLPQLVADVFVTDSDSRLAGAVPISDLVRADPAASLGSLAEHGKVSVRPDDDFTEVARRMADFNLTVAPVVDGEDRLIGAITVDDVLEAMLPESWRRRADAAED
ncbi:MAG: magnesium transporter [Candidatus Dormibacteraeota bacterium]|nr:magnesium transporter [Candidatus Dormibacteraeota bacterium]